MRHVSTVLALALVFAASPASAQEWSDEQMEVWRNVETYWELGGAKEDLEGFLGYFHEDFLGWRRGDLFPTNKADRRVLAERFFETGESVLVLLKPLGIKVHGNVAIVHYFYSETIRDSEGTEESDYGYWTDILMKQGNKWVMIADAGGSTANN
jgi:ketosteroid isomerase-like protein